jgi:hypothetical protein
VLHDETKNPVDMVKVFEGRPLIGAVTIPDDWKPLAGLDQVGGDQQTGDEAVKLFEQHGFLAKGEQFLVKLFEAARQTGHGRSNSVQQFVKPPLREAGDAGEHSRHRQGELSSFQPATPINLAQTSHRQLGWGSISAD